MTPAEQTAIDRVRKARANLVISQPFFAALALKLALVPHVPGDHKTAAVDGRNLYFHPEFIAAQSDEVLRTVVAHEAMHCALGHPFRRGARDSELWNIAADHVINNILKKSGFAAVDGWLCDLRFADPALATEHVYATLKAEQPPKNPGGQGHDFGGCGEVLDAAGDDGAAPSEADLEDASPRLAGCHLSGRTSGQGARQLPGHRATADQ